MGITVEYEDIIGKKYHQLEVKKFLGKKPGQRAHSVYYLCKCECGNEKDVTRGNLITHHTRSCGCLKKKKGKENKCWLGHGDISGGLWTHIQCHAKGRDLDFAVTIEEAWAVFQQQGGRCALTGWPIALNTEKGCRATRTASLDRIDNTKGYTKDNIQWLHKDVNWMKGRYSSQRFYEMCKAVADYKGGVK
jgi:hypothetical protein